MSKCPIRSWLQQLTKGYLEGQVTGLSWSYSRSRGPGGQHVNTTDSKVTLTFNRDMAHWLPLELKPTIMTKTFNCDAHRSRIQNQRECLEKLENWLRALAKEKMEPAPPSFSQQSRVARLKLEEKLQRKKEKTKLAAKKQGRQRSISLFD